MLTRRKRELLNEKVKVRNRDRVINGLKTENKKLLKEISDLKMLIENIGLVNSSNRYNNSDVAKRKINELVNDYQSTN